MIYKITGSSVTSRPAITGVSYLRGYIKVKKLQSEAISKQERISIRYFDQLFHHNYLANHIISSLRPSTTLQHIDNSNYFEILQGLVRKMQSTDSSDAQSVPHLQILQEEISMHQEVFSRRLNESTV